jgi:hypothetical protein
LALHPVVNFWEAVGVERAREYMHGLAMKAGKLFANTLDLENIILCSSLLFSPWCIKMMLWIIFVFKSLVTSEVLALIPDPFLSCGTTHSDYVNVGFLGKLPFPKSTLSANNT